jgi:hypothetical protein
MYQQKWKKGDFQKLGIGCSISSFWKITLTLRQVYIVEISIKFSIYFHTNMTHDKQKKWPPLKRAIDIKLLRWHDSKYRKIAFRKSSYKCFSGPNLYEALLALKITWHFTQGMLKSCPGHVQGCAQGIVQDFTQCFWLSLVPYLW